jgi:hypothetical protein
MTDKYKMAFLEMAGSGGISGQVVEWPQLKPTCAWGGTYTPKPNVLLYIGLDQCRMTTRKEWAKDVIREQPFFAVTYDPKAEAMLELNRRLRKLHRG